MADSDKPGGGRHLRYAIIGAGMAGILAGIKLNERGETDYTIYEKGDSVGGTWRENRYPGLKKMYLSNRPNYLSEYEGWVKLLQELFVARAGTAAK